MPCSTHPENYIDGPNNKFTDKDTLEIIQTTVDYVINNDIQLCDTMSRLCSTLNLACDENVYRLAMLALGMPQDTTNDVSDSWRTLFTSLCYEDTQLRRAGGWMRKGLLKKSRDFLPFQLHTAVRRLDGSDMLALKWLMQARGGDATRAHQPIPAGEHFSKLVRRGVFTDDYSLPLYGPMREWDVADVDDMSNVFFDSELLFQPDISLWDVSNVRSMRSMFEMSKFNGDISRWDVSSVMDMQDMFAEASNFNQNLSRWDVSNVTTMAYMFYRASSFQSNLSQWSVVSVTRMDSMFYGASSFESDLSQWKVAKVTSATHFLLNASSFDSDKAPQFTY